MVGVMEAAADAFGGDDDDLGGGCHVECCSGGRSLGTLMKMMDHEEGLGMVGGGVGKLSSLIVWRGDSKPQYLCWIAVYGPDQLPMRWRPLDT